MVHLLFTQKQAALVLYVLTLVQSTSPGSLHGPFTVHPETSGPRAVRVNSSAIHLTGKFVWSTQKQAALMLCSGVS